MTYTPQTWADGTAGNTPISAARLNHMESGIGGSSDQLDGYLAALGKVTLTGMYGSPTLYHKDAASWSDSFSSLTVDYNAGFIQLQTQDPGLAEWFAQGSDTGTVRRMINDTYAAADNTFSQSMSVYSLASIQSDATNKLGQVAITTESNVYAFLAEVTDTHSQLLLTGVTGQTDPILKLRNSDALDAFTVTSTASQTQALTSFGDGRPRIEHRLSDDGTLVSSQLDLGAFDTYPTPSAFSSVNLYSTIHHDGTLGNAGLIVTAGGGQIQLDSGNSTSIALSAISGQTGAMVVLFDSLGNTLYDIRPYTDGVFAVFNDNAGNSRVQINTDPSAAQQAISVHSESGSEASGDWGATDLNGVQLYMEGKIGGNAIDYLPIYSSGGANRLFAITPTAALDFLEQTTPSAPPANTARLYTKDVGGKTGLYVLFPSGAEQQIKVEL